MSSSYTPDVSPYVSLGRLRLVQKLLWSDSSGDKQKPLDAIFCAIGEDSDYSDGALDLVIGINDRLLKHISFHSQSSRTSKCQSNLRHDQIYSEVRMIHQMRSHIR